MSEQPRLHHLLDRMRRGVLLPAEREQLAGLVTDLEKRAAQTGELLTIAHETSNRSEAERARAAAIVDRVRQMTTYWELNLPETIRTPAVVSALRAATDPPR